jgi:hypothetical protein
MNNEKETYVIFESQLATAIYNGAMKYYALKFFKDTIYKSFPQISVENLDALIIRVENLLTESALHETANADIMSCISYFSPLQLQWNQHHSGNLYNPRYATLKSLLETEIDKIKERQLADFKSKVILRKNKDLLLRLKNFFSEQVKKFDVAPVYNPQYICCYSTEPFPSPQ